MVLVSIHPTERKGGEREREQAMVLVSIHPTERKGEKERGNKLWSLLVFTKREPENNTSLFIVLGHLYKCLFIIYVYYTYIAGDSHALHIIYSTGRVTSFLCCWYCLLGRGIAQQHHGVRGSMSVSLPMLSFD